MYKYEYGEDPGEIFRMQEFYDQLTPAAIRDAAQAYLDPSRYVKVTLLPEALTYNSYEISAAYDRDHRRVRLRFSAALFVAVAAVLVATGYAQISRGSARDFSATALTGLPFRGWPTNGGNLYNQRYSPLKAINRDNVVAAERRVADASARLRRRAAVLGLRAAAGRPTASPT